MKQFYRSFYADNQQAFDRVKALARKEVSRDIEKAGHNPDNFDIVFELVPRDGVELSGRWAATEVKT